jgi:hypothetical protein
MNEPKRADRIAAPARTIAGDARHSGPLSMLPADPDHVACSDYHHHATEHTRDGAGWRCRICQPRPGDR